MQRSSQHNGKLKTLILNNTCFHNNADKDIQIDEITYMYTFLLCHSLHIITGWQYMNKYIAKEKLRVLLIINVL